LTRTLRPEARRQHALAAPRAADQFTFASHAAQSEQPARISFCCAPFKPLAPVTADGSFLVGVIRTYLKIAGRSRYAINVGDSTHGRAMGTDPDAFSGGAHSRLSSRTQTHPDTSRS